MQALQSRTVDRFKGRFRDVDLLLLEDVHFLQGKEKMQDEVLSTIKSLQEKGSRVVLTSSFAPCELRNVDNSLVSRFCSGFLAGIEKPDASTRRRILQEKARQNNALLSDTVVDVLTERLTGDIRQLESCVHNLLLNAKLLGCTISVEMAQEILAQYSLDDPFVDVDSIIRSWPPAAASRIWWWPATRFSISPASTPSCPCRTSATNFPAGIPRCSRASLRLSASCAASRPSGVRLPARWLCWSGVRFPPALSKGF